MFFYYGYDDNHYVNVTDKVFRYYLSDGGIFIPVDGREDVLGNPYPDTIKHILVVDALGIKHKFNQSCPISIRIPSISEQLKKNNIKILYGYKNNYTDVTSIMFKKCLVNGRLHIPAGERGRCEIIGFDPYPNVLKEILICDDNNSINILSHTDEITIDFNL